MDRSTCPKIIGDVHLWGQKCQTTTTTTTKMTTQQPLLWMFVVFHVHQPPYLHSFAIWVCHLGGWNCPKFMHQSKLAEILILGISTLWYPTKYKHVILLLLLLLIDWLILCIDTTHALVYRSIMFWTFHTTCSLEFCLHLWKVVRKFDVHYIILMWDWKGQKKLYNF